MYVESRRDDRDFEFEYDDEACMLEKKSKDEINRIETAEDGSFFCKLCISSAYYGFLIGRNGEKKQSLERETQTKIFIPGRGKGEQVKIQGKSKSDVVSCRDRIILLISSARHQKPFTHLLTFPLCFDNLIRNFKQFKEDVLKNCSNDRGVDESIFQNPNKLHLTICTLNLTGDMELDQAVGALDECRKTFVRDLLESKPLAVHIKGLEYMNDDPSEVDVLYAKVNSQDSNKIQGIANKLMEKFVEIGFSKKQYDQVKLHATVMNTLMRQETADEANEDQQKNIKQSKSNKTRKTFDARNILRIFGDYDFGSSFVLKDIDISIRYSTALNGYYEYISKINL